MLNMNRILAPVDFSEASAAAARHAGVLARHFHSDIVLLHVQTPARYVGGGLEGAYLAPLPEVVAEQRRRDLDLFLQDELQDLSVSRVLAEGDVAHQILESVRTEKINLIVMATHGYGPFRRFILGSVTAKVLHDVECPVWTGVHWKEAPSRNAAPIRKVMCAVDLGPHSRRTLCMAAQMAASFEALLALVHATPPMELAGAGGKYFTPEWGNAIRSQTAERMAKLQQELGTNAEVYIDGGDAPKVVRQAAEQAGADLLVIGRSPAAEGLAGRLRTNAYAIIRESPCPVLSV